MIEVRDVVTSVLYGLGENANRKHSDPEIIDALNIVKKRGFCQIPLTQITLSNGVLKQNAGW